MWTPIYTLCTPNFIFRWYEPLACQNRPQGSISTNLGTYGLKKTLITEYVYSVRYRIKKNNVQSILKAMPLTILMRRIYFIFVIFKYINTYVYMNYKAKYVVIKVKQISNKLVRVTNRTWHLPVYYIKLIWTRGSINKTVLNSIYFDFAVLEKLHLSFKC